MGLACRGLTHCNKCGSPLDMGEYFLCKGCRTDEEDEEIKLEENQKKEVLKAKVVEEVKEEMKGDITKELVKSRFNTPIEEISINIDKPKGMSFDEWYAIVGNLVLGMSQKGNCSILVNFIKEEE